jgi:hypothetical protein
MNTVSDVLGNSGSAITVEFDDGKILTISRLDQKGKTRIEQHVKALAREQLTEDKETMSDQEYALAYGAFLDRVSSGDYKFGGRIYAGFIGSGSGGLYLARMLSSWQNGKSPTEDEMVEIMGDRKKQAKLTAAIQQSIAESFPKASAPVQDRGTSDAAG